jgi:hypothetical protein
MFTKSVFTPAEVLGNEICQRWLCERICYGQAKMDIRWTEMDRFKIELLAFGTPSVVPLAALGDRHGVQLPLGL